MARLLDDGLAKLMAAVGFRSGSGSGSGGLDLVKRQTTTGTVLQTTQQQTAISTVKTSTPAPVLTTSTPPPVASSASGSSPQPVASSSPPAAGSSTLLTTTTTGTRGVSSSGAGGSTPTTATGGASSSGAGGTATTTPAVITTTTKPVSVPVSTSIADTSIVGLISPAIVTGSTTNPIVSFPTSSYTGQAVLTSTCAQPLYTAFQEPDGSYLAAPIIGCDNQNPQCCPSLTAGPTAASTIIPLNQLNGAVMDALNNDPITVCPGDYTSTAGVCCPVGFNLYQVQFYNLYPCVSTLPTAYSVPPAITNQLISLSAAIASTATNANPTVSVHIVTDQVFALSLPLKGGVERTTPVKSGLPLAAKIGIGVGAVLIFVLLGLLILFCVTRNRRRGGRSTQQGGIAPGSQTPAWLDAQRKSLASTATAPTATTSWDPRQGHFSYDSAASSGDPTSAGGYYKPAGEANPYVRTPPQRTSLQPMPMAQLGYGLTGGAQPTYSELPGQSAEHEVFEADASQPYAGHGYGDGGSTAYQGPAHGQEAYEMDGLSQQQPPPPPQQQQQGYQAYQPYRHQVSPPLPPQQQRHNEWI